jgi:hypothetical protein
VKDKSYETAIAQLYSTSNYFTPLLSKYFLRSPTSNTFSMRFSHNVWYQISHPYKTIALWFSNLFIFRHQTRRQGSGLNCSKCYSRLIFLFERSLVLFTIKKHAFLTTILMVLLSLWKQTQTYELESVSSNHFPIHHSLRVLPFHALFVTVELLTESNGLRFSRRSFWRMSSFGMRRRLALVRTKISEELTANAVPSSLILISWWLTG